MCDSTSSPKSFGIADEARVSIAVGRSDRGHSCGWE